MASAILGFGRDVVVAAVFGAGAELDAFLVAQGMMNLVLGLVSSAVATALVPVVAREAAGDGGVRRANHTVTVAMPVTLVVLGLASVVLWLFAGPAVSALAPGFDGEQADLAVQTTGSSLWPSSSCPGRTCWPRPRRPAGGSSGQECRASRSTSR